MQIRPVIERLFLARLHDNNSYSDKYKACKTVVHTQRQANVEIQVGVVRALEFADCVEIQGR